MADKTQARMIARQLAETHVDKGDPTGWFDILYSRAQGDDNAIPWADMTPNRHFMRWAIAHELQGNGRSALVVGCGLGDDAEELARRGFNVTAFDVSSAAITWCKQRFPSSTVNYQAADLFALPQAWLGSFDFVLECYTVQALPQAVRARAIECIANCVAPSGELLVVCRGRAEEEEPLHLPWPLSRSEIDHFEQHGLHALAFEDFMDPDEPTARRFRVLYRRG